MTLRVWLSIYASVRLSSVCCPCFRVDPRPSHWLTRFLLPVLAFRVCQLLLTFSGSLCAVHFLTLATPPLTLRHLRYMPVLLSPSALYIYIHIHACFFCPLLPRRHLKLRIFGKRFLWNERDSILEQTERGDRSEMTAAALLQAWICVCVYVCVCVCTGTKEHWLWEWVPRLRMPLQPCSPVAIWVWQTHTQA